MSVWYDYCTGGYERSSIIALHDFACFFEFSVTIPVSSYDAFEIAAWMLSIGSRLLSSFVFVYHLSSIHCLNLADLGVGTNTQLMAETAVFKILLLL
ncbi:hypothetical protein P8452_42189 [Trifolium repens]|nr:phosphotransferase/inositol or phosphatidylinositol kinase [Trifolium repens]WJX56538.1 hypothetical protein P8452_42189 [Trifolium repens]